MGNQTGDKFLYARRPSSFLGTETEFDKARFVVVGAPLDVTGTFRSGYRNAPLMIRAASSQLETYSSRYSFDVENAAIHDLGDLNVGFDVLQAVKVLEESVTQVRTNGKIPLVLGGEHTITFGSFLGSGADKLVVFDAHMDLRDDYQGLTLSHATWLKRLTEKVSPEHILIVGARATSSDELASRPREVNILSLSDIDSRTKEFANWVGGKGGCYVSIDLDFFDPAYAPGVGNPEPEGASPAEFFHLLSLLQKPKIVGADVCELIPTLDPSGITSILAAKVLIELVSLISVRELAQ